MEPYAIMVGVITDAYRMRRTKVEWIEKLQEFSAETGNQIEELHTRDLYRGRGPWDFRKINGKRRIEIIDSIIDWMEERNHNIVFSSVDKSLYNQNFHDEPPYANDIQSIWQFLAFHITLSIQRAFNNTKKNKGNTVLIFDREDWDKKQYTDLILNSPDWADEYYSKGKKDEKLNQIVDVPHFVDSKHVELIQLADFCCYFIRLFLEIQGGHTKEQYPTEQEDLRARFFRIKKLAIPLSNIYPQRGRNSALELFYKYGVNGLKE